VRKRVYIALAIVLVAVTGVIAWQVLQVLREREPLTGASGSKPSPNQAQAFAAALFELHGQWTTNGNDVIFSRARWPASLKALKVNGLEVNRFWARASRREDGPLGIWWSSGYQVQRQHTNDTTWTLYRVHSFGGPGMKGFRWRSVGTAVTNAP
jgi:hypothetical protein